MKKNKDNNSFTNRLKKMDPNSKGERSFLSRYLSKKSKEHFLNIGKKSKSNESFFREESIKNKSRNFNSRSFADIARRSRSDLIYLVRGKDQGRQAWHYILVDRDKKEIFLARSKTGSMDIADYGEILYSGWGKDPSQEIVNKINEEFGLN